MISKKELKGFGFSSMIEFYNYIVESKTNGQFKQVRELVKKLSQRQYNSFLKYLDNHDILLEDCFLRD